MDAKSSNNKLLFIVGDFPHQNDLKYFLATEHSFEQVEISNF